MKSAQIFVLALLLGIAFQGPFALPVTAAPDEKILLDKFPSSAVVLNASTRHETGRHQIRGYALRRSTNRTSGSGHIDCEIFSPSGQSILVERIALVSTPLPRGVHGRSSFYWDVPATVPHGARVQLRYHAGAHGSAWTHETGS